MVACDWQRDGNLMFFSFQLPVNVAQVFMGSGMAAFDPIRWTCLWLLPFHLQYFSIGIQCSTAGRIETQRLCLICQYYFKTWPGEEQPESRQRTCLSHPVSLACWEIGGELKSMSVSCSAIILTFCFSFSTGAAKWTGSESG